MRPIDADELKTHKVFDKFGLEYVVPLAHIENSPTIDPVKHGRWIINSDNFTPAKRCSCCGYNKPIAAGENIKQEPDNFCPNCGASMIWEDDKND